MDRRAFLAGLLAALPGCETLGAEGETATLTPAPVPTVTERPARTPVRTAGRFDHVRCPDLVFGSPPRVCSHTAPDEAALLLVPRPVVVAVDDGDPARPVRMTLRVNVTERLTVFTEGWRLFRHGFRPGRRPVRSDPGNSVWTHVAGQVDRAAQRTVDPDEAHHWALGLAASERESVTPVTAPLEPGVHAFVTVVRGQSSTIQWACVAVFEAVASPDADGSDGGE